MRLSTTTGFYRHRPDGIEIPMTDCIRKLHAIGYEDVDLNFCMTKKETPEKGKCKELEPDNWHDWVLEMKELLAELGMTASQAHAPFYNVLDKDYPDREHTEEIVRRSANAWKTIWNITSHIWSWLPVTACLWRWKTCSTRRTPHGNAGGTALPPERKK